MSVPSIESASAAIRLAAHLRRAALEKVLADRRVALEQDLRQAATDGVDVESPAFEVCKLIAESLIIDFSQPATDKHDTSSKWITLRSDVGELLWRAANVGIFPRGLPADGFRTGKLPWFRSCSFNYAEAAVLTTPYIEADRAMASFRSNYGAVARLPRPPLDVVCRVAWATCPDIRRAFVSANLSAEAAALLPEDKLADLLEEHGLPRGLLS